MNEILTSNFPIIDESREFSKKNVCGCKVVVDTTGSGLAVSFSKDIKEISPTWKITQYNQKGILSVKCSNKEDG